MTHSPAPRRELIINTHIQFYHPNTGSKKVTTQFHRKNLSTLKWETAGEIEWTSDARATVQFGIDRVRAAAASDA